MFRYFTNPFNSAIFVALTYSGPDHRFCVRIFIFCKFQFAVHIGNNDSILSIYYQDNRRLRAVLPEGGIGYSSSAKSFGIEYNRTISYIAIRTKSKNIGLQDPKQNRLSYPSKVEIRSTPLFKMLGR